MRMEREKYSNGSSEWIAKKSFGQWSERRRMKKGQEKGKGRERKKRLATWGRDVDDESRVS